MPSETVFSPIVNANHAPQAHALPLPRTLQHAGTLVQRAASIILVASTLVEPAYAATSSEHRITCEDTDAPSDYRTYNGPADVTWTKRQDIVPVPRIYAWEQARITVTESVNANRERYEERKCGFLGLSCHYEQRIRNGFVSPEQVPFDYALIRSNGDVSQTALVDKSGTSIAIAADYAGYWRAVKADDNERLIGMVGASHGEIDRTSCDGNPRVCSVGSYTVKVEIDSGPRAKRMIDELNQVRWSYDQLMSAEILNANLRQSSTAVRACVARALLKQALSFWGPNSGASPIERQKILQQALEFDSTDVDIKTALASSYLETGQFDLSKQQTESALAADEAAIRSNSATPDVLVNAADNYVLLAEVEWRRTAGDSTQAAITATNDLRLAVERFQSRLHDYPADQTNADARVKLANASIRLAQILSRRGTSETMAEAIDGIARARSELPRHFDGVKAIEVDASLGQLVTARAPGQLVLDASWTQDTVSLPLQSGFAITAPSLDMQGAQTPAVFRMGMGVLDVMSLQAFVKGDLDAEHGPKKLLVPSAACLTQAAVLPNGSGFSASVSRSGDNTTLQFGDNETQEIEGAVRAVALARGPSASIATLAWHKSGIAASAGWELTDWEVDGRQRSRTVNIPGAESDEVALRAGPDHLYAIGRKSIGRSDLQWTLVSMGDAPTLGPLVCRGESGETGMDDVALLKASDGTIEVLGLSATCPGITGKATAEGATLQADAQHEIKGLREALKGRKAAIAWATASNEPLGIISWIGVDHLASAQQIIVARSSHGAPAAGGLYKANLSRYAFGGRQDTTLQCGGATIKRDATFDRLRVTGLSIVPATAEGAPEHPKVSFVSASVTGAVSIIETGRRADTQPAVDQVRIATSRKSTAFCNTGDFVDYRYDDTGSIWARARDGGEIVRLNPNECGTLRLGGRLLPSLRRYHMPSQGAAHVQIFDTNVRDHLTKLSIAPAADSPPAQLPDECPLKAGADLASGVGACTKAEVASAFGMPDAEVQVLWRDISSDPRRIRNQDTVARASALALLSPSAAGSSKVRIVDLPLGSTKAGRTYSLPDDAHPVAVLTHADAYAIVAASSGKLAAYVDDAGTKRGEVAVDPAFTDTDRARRLVSGDRLLLVANGTDSGSPARLMALGFDENGLSIAKDCSPCDLQTDASLQELQDRLKQRPPANAEGRLERFAADAAFSRVLFPKTLLQWSDKALTGSPGPVFSATPPSLPYLIGEGQAYMAGGANAIDSWTVR